MVKMIPENVRAHVILALGRIIQEFVLHPAEINLGQILQRNFAYQPVLRTNMGKTALDLAFLIASPDLVRTFQEYVLPIVLRHPMVILPRLDCVSQTALEANTEKIKHDFAPKIAQQAMERTQHTYARKNV